MIKELFAKDVVNKYGDFTIPEARGTGGMVMVKALFVFKYTFNNLECIFKDKLDNIKYG